MMASIVTKGDKLLAKKLEKNTHTESRVKAA